MMASTETRHHYLAPDRLTPGETTLIETLSREGCSVGVAATILGITPKTAENRARVIREKMGVEFIEEAVSLWRARRDAA